MHPDMLNPDSPPPKPDPDFAMDAETAGYDDYLGVIDQQQHPPCYSSPPSLDPWAYLARLGIRLRTPSDPFLSDGDAVCGVAQCVYLTQEDDEVFLHPEHPEFPCPEPECPATFTLLLDFESHYATLHKHECSQCGRTLPSAHLLELHLAEMHDSFFAVMSKKNASYECFLQRCRDKFWTPEDRRSHCIRRHQFPEDFRFGDICDLKDFSSSSSTPRRKSSSSTVSSCRAKSSPAREQRVRNADKSPVKKKLVGGVAGNRMDVDQPGSLIPRPVFSTSPSKCGPNSPRQLNNPQGSSSSSPIKSSTSPRATSLSPKLKPSYLRRKNNNESGSSGSNNNTPSSSPRKRVPKQRPHSVLISPSAADNLMITAPGQTKTSTNNSPSEYERRRFSLAMITGGPLPSNQPEIPPVTTTASTVPSIEHSRLLPFVTNNCDNNMSSDPSFSSSSASKADSVDVAAQSNPVTPHRTPLSLARMGERLSTSSSTSSRSDRFSVPNLAALSNISPPMSMREPPCPSSESPSKKASRIPVLKRSLSCKVPKQICFGSDATPSFQSDGRMFWHSRAPTKEEGNKSVCRDVEMHFEEDLRKALPDMK